MMYALLLRARGRGWGEGLRKQAEEIRCKDARVKSDEIRLSLEIGVCRGARLFEAPARLTAAIAPRR